MHRSPAIPTPTLGSVFGSTWFRKPPFSRNHGFCNARRLVPAWFHLVPLVTRKRPAHEILVFVMPSAWFLLGSIWFRGHAHSERAVASVALVSGPLLGSISVPDVSIYNASVGLRMGVRPP